jgi:hypothetical protein
MGLLRGGEGVDLSASLWDKVDLSVMETAADVQPETSTKPKRNWRRIFRFGEFLGATCWGLAIVKIFVFDFDRYIADRLGPPFDLIVQFRFLVILGAIAVLVVVLLNQAWVLLAYIALFPLIFVLWIIPRTLVKLRSWNLILAIISLMSSWLHKFNLRFIVRVLEIITCVVALTTSTAWVAIACACALGVALIGRYVQTIVSGVRRSKFSRYQETLVEVATKVSFNGYIEPDLKSDEVERFTKDQLEKFANTVANGVIQVKILTFYAALLRQYRQSHAVVFLNLLSYAWLFIQSAILLALINYSVYVAAPDQFRIDGRATIPQFFYYATTSLYGNTVPQINASGDVAVVIATATAFYGPLFLLAFGLQIIANLRQAKDDAAFGELAQRLKSREKELSTEIQAEYEVSPDEALRRLRELGNSTGNLFAYWVSKMPTDPSDGGGANGP